MVMMDDYLSARGVTDPAVIQGRGYRPVAEGIRIPLYTIASAETDRVESGYEVRLIPPKVRKVNGKEKVQKFDRPAGQRQFLSVNPSTWQRPKDGEPLWIVEGTLRADALAHLGVRSVLSMTSVWGFRNGRDGIDTQLNELSLRDREVWLWPDGDVLTNPDVNRATFWLASILEARGAIVRYGVIPDGQGLDDYLASGKTLLDLRILVRDELPNAQEVEITEESFTQGTSLPRTSDAALARAWLSECKTVGHVDGIWWAWVGGRWVSNPGGSTARMNLLPWIERVAHQYWEIGEQGNKAQRQFGRKTREILESSAKCASVLQQGLAVHEAERRADQFDQKPWLLNLANGTLDLRERTFKPHDPADLLTGISPTNYDPAATAPEFEEFLAASLPDPEVRAYLQRMLGATLVGMTLSQRVLVLSGPPRAGKGTLIRAIEHMFGRDYSGELRREVILKSNRTDHQTQVMWLKGKRLAAVNETNPGEEFDGAKLKMLSGGDEITARGMNQDQQTFRPSHNLILSTNNLPNVDTSDLALWSRLRVIPFTQSFLGREDETLDERLAEEAPGILNWMIEGLRRYLEEGGEGQPPRQVERAKSAWRENGDTMAGFTEDLLDEPVPAGQRLSRADLRVRYEDWCRTNTMDPLPANSPQFKAGLQAAGFTEVREVDGKSRPWVWKHEKWSGPPVQKPTKFVSVDVDMIVRRVVGQVDRWLTRRAMPI